MKQHIVKPLVDELAARLTPTPVPVPTPTTKPQTAELDQDPGGSYNNGHVYPQA